MNSPVWTQIFDKPEIIGVMLPMVGILAFAIIVIVKILIHHRERMAMIERGLNPDYPPDESGVNRNPPSKI